MKFWHRLNDRRTPLGKGFRTFYQVFIPTLLTSLLGFFGQVSEWASCVADCQPFPDPGVLPKMLVSAFVAAMPALIAYVMNLIEDKRADRQIIDAEPIDDGEPQQIASIETLVEARTSEGEQVVGMLEVLDDGVDDEDEDEGDLELVAPVELVVVDDALASQPPMEWDEDAHNDEDRFEGVDVQPVEES